MLLSQDVAGIFPSLMPNSIAMQVLRCGDREFSFHLRTGAPAQARTSMETAALRAPLPIHRRYAFALVTVSDGDGRYYTETGRVRPVWA